MGFLSLELTSCSHQKAVSAINITALHNPVQSRNLGQPLCQLCQGVDSFLEASLFPHQLAFLSILHVRTIIPLLHSFLVEVKLLGLFQTDQSLRPGAVVGGCHPWLYWILNKIDVLQTKQEEEHYYWVDQQWPLPYLFFQCIVHHSVVFPEQQWVFVFYFQIMTWVIVFRAPQKWWTTEQHWSQTYSTSSCWDILRIDYGLKVILSNDNLNNTTLFICLFVSIGNNSLE